jgi:hypothetical protein
MNPGEKVGRGMPEVSSFNPSITVSNIKILRFRSDGFLHDRIKAPSEAVNKKAML